MLSTLVHLRLPFFIFLLPIFLFGAMAAGPLDGPRFWQAFVIIHFLLYPASNGFNSYFDKDKGSIGGIKNPPPVKKSLLVISLVLDGIALVWGWFVSPVFAVGLLIYGLFSKAYSWPPIRLKKYPVVSWLAVALGQGSLTFLLTALTVGTGGPMWSSWSLWLGAVLTGVFLAGGYPLTQVYQHQEDRERGDRTLSLILGIRGTFVLSGAFMGLSALGFSAYFLAFADLQTLVLFMGLQTPTLGFFLYWAIVTWKNPARADFLRAMIMNFISSGLMNLFFGIKLAMG